MLPQVTRCFGAFPAPLGAEGWRGRLHSALRRSTSRAWRTCREPPCPDSKSPTNTGSHKRDWTHTHTQLPIHTHMPTYLCVHTCRASAARHIHSILASHAMPSHAIPAHPIPCHRMPSHPIPSHPMPSHAIPCHPVPSHLIPSYPFVSHTCADTHAHTDRHSFTDEMRRQTETQRHTHTHAHRSWIGARVMHMQLQNGGMAGAPSTSRTRRCAFL